MLKEKNSISIGTAALITGLSVFLPTAPYAEFYVFKKLIIYNDALQTVQNLTDNPKLFLSGVFAMFINFMIDILLAWTLYIFLKPVNASLSLLAAWFRIIYTVVGIVAIFNFLYAFQVANHPAFDTSFKAEQVFFWVNARHIAMEFAYIIFGIYLILAGILIYKASYVPKIFGVLMMLAGISWIVISLKPYIFKDFDLSWLMIFSAGELFFAIWLLIKGSRIKEDQLNR